MLKKMMQNTNESYGVYYLVYGSLAGDDRLVKSYFWAGPYTNLKLAWEKAEELKDSHQGDDAFVVRRYDRDLG
jgi:hypothetical protein